MSLRKLLVANRGEIACRVMRTAQRQGLATVAVYSDADACAPHVAMADEAVRIGPAPASESYLNIDALLDAARRTRADAVHPGYGFLSERADFARACEQAGLVFVGPPAAAIEAMGDKAAAKRRMIAAGVPCAPGTLDDDLADEQLCAEGARIGAPLLVKAVAGGGGRGMRLVRDLADLPAALATARREAESAFGDGALMLERLIDDARHVEVQVFADRHGHVVHLGERDCTAQRRRQKLIEESPSPIVTPALREALCRDAVAAARAVGYVGAGTVEFVVDGEQRHYFLEMNTRLQVEHPVTECLTGIDLVEWQLRVADGESLPLAQDQIRFEGHAIEARLVAEDPGAGFRPTTGRVLGWRPDAAGVRVDLGVVEGQELTPHYDGLLAKLIAHGHDRADAIRRLVRALERAPLFGPVTNSRFLRELLDHPRFVQATMTTTLIDEWTAAQPVTEPALQRPPPPEDAWRIAAAALGGEVSGRAASIAGFDLTLRCGHEQRRLRVPIAGVTMLPSPPGELRCEVDGVIRRLPAWRDLRSLHIAIDAAVFAFNEPSPLPAQETTRDPRQVRASVAGTVGQVAVAVGDTVAEGQPLVSIEAMKMEMWHHAAAAGIVRHVHAAVRSVVAADALLVELEHKT